jgi:8-oxo-dGTP pyrophosphatase MutT (NUDIX family)
MGKPERKVVYDGGQFFRVEHQPIEGRERPYEFVRRIGATTVLPIISLDGSPHVLGIHNTRAFYGASLGLPGGNADGGFEHPEHPTVTGIREVGEETGYGYPGDSRPNVNTFLLRAVSNSILYDRSFSIARDLEYVGGEVMSAHEVVDLRPMPVDEYLAPVFAMQRGELYPEVVLAIAKSGVTVGIDETTDWIVRGDSSPYAQDVVASFDPWMVSVE